MWVSITLLSIALEPCSSSSDGPARVAADFAVLLHPGLGVVVCVFSDHLLIISVAMVVEVEGHVDHCSA